MDIKKTNLNRFTDLIRESLEDLDSADFFYHTDFEEIAIISLTIFNQTPKFSSISYKDTEELEKYRRLIVHTGTLIGLSVIDLEYYGDLYSLSVSKIICSKWNEEWEILFNDIKNTKVISDTRTNICTQCGEKSPYVEPVEGYRCWGCRNGY